MEGSVIIMKNETAMKAFIANLGKYNDGELVGKWVKPAGLDADDWKEILESIGVDEAHEYFIPDYEYAPDFLGEYESLEHVTEVADVVDEYGLDLFNAVYDSIGDFEQTRDILDDGDYVVYDAADDEELGECLVDEGLLGEIPARLSNYIDYEAIGRDFAIETCGSFETINNRTQFIEIVD